MTHGTSCAYSKYKCRCMTCREAHRVRMRDYHARSKQTDYKPKAKGPKNRITNEQVEAIWEKHLTNLRNDGFQIGQTKQGAMILLGYDWGRSPLENL